MRTHFKKIIELECPVCNVRFIKDLKEYTRQNKNRPGHIFYCSSKCSGQAQSLKHEITKICECCGKPFKSTPGIKSNKNCSRSCAGKVSRKKQGEQPGFKENLSKKNKENWEKGVYKKKRRIQRLDIKGRPLRPHYEVKCSICGAVFTNVNKKVQTCSKSCSSKLRSRLSRDNPNCGGETNYRKYRYKDITFDSSWEVDIAKFLDEKNVKWERSRKICFHWTDDSGDKRRYYPDFYLPEFNIYLDPKNKFLLIKDFDKLERVKVENGINLVYGLKDDVLNEVKKFLN